MSGKPEKPTVGSVLLGPLATWAGLCLVLALTYAYANWPGLPTKLAAGLSFAAVKAGLIALFFMQIRVASGIARIAAAAGLLWLSFMFLLTFSDLLTR